MNASLMVSIFNKPSSSRAVNVQVNTVANCVQTMRVWEVPSIRTSRYAHKKRKCWSQLSIGAYGRKDVFCLSYVLGISELKMMA